MVQRSCYGTALIATSLTLAWTIAPTELVKFPIPFDTCSQETSAPTPAGWPPEPPWSSFIWCGWEPDDHSSRQLNSLPGHVYPAGWGAAAADYAPARPGNSLGGSRRIGGRVPRLAASSGTFGAQPDGIPI